jgi:hypothetical protein
VPDIERVEIGVVRLGRVPRPHSLKPMRSNALFHSSTPAMTVGGIFQEMLRSTQKTIGCLRLGKRRGRIFLFQPPALIVIDARRDFVSSAKSKTVVTK